MDKAKDLLVFQSVRYIIDWDMETMMPPKAVGLRSQQLALLSRIEHKMSTDPEIGMLLESILHNPKYDYLDEVQKRNVYLMKKQYDEQTALPEDLVAEIAKQRTIAVDVWKKPKQPKTSQCLDLSLKSLWIWKRKLQKFLWK